MTTTNNKTTAYIVRIPEGRIYEIVRVLMDIYYERAERGNAGSDTDLIIKLASALDNAQSLSERCESEAKEWEDAQGKYNGKDEWAEKCKHKAKALREFAKLY